MKSIIFVLLAGLILCGCGFLKHGQILCDKNSRCENFTIENGLSLRYKEIVYRYFHGRRILVLTCTVENNSNNQLLFDRRSFSIISNKEKYELQPWMIYKNSKLQTMPDTFSLKRGEIYMEYVFDFKSENKITRKKFYKFFLSDTLRLEYANGDQKNNVLRFIGRKD